MQPWNPNWHDLRIFLEVARTGSVAKSARLLRMDASTVSRHIARLEQSLNMPLFERDPTGLKTTARGQSLVEHVQAMESHALALSDTALPAQLSEPAGTVRVGTMEGIGAFYLAGRLMALRDRHPGIDIELLTSPQHVQVTHREADVFISFFPPDGRGLDVSQLGQFELHLYASLDYLARHGTPASRKDLARHAFVSYVEELVQLDTVRWLDEVVANARTVFRSTSMVAQMFAAAAGGGIVMLPSFMSAESIGLVRLLPQDVWLSRTVWLTVHQDLQYMPRIKAVAGFLRESFARDFRLSR